MTRKSGLLNNGATSDLNSAKVAHTRRAFISTSFQFRTPPVSAWEVEGRREKEKKYVKYDDFFLWSKTVNRA